MKLKPRMELKPRVHGSAFVCSITRAHSGVDVDAEHSLDLHQAALPVKCGTSLRDLESLFCVVACSGVLLLFRGLCDFAVGMERSSDNPTLLGVMLGSTTVLYEQVYFQRAAPISSPNRGNVMLQMRW
jgi:hypothetical protein